MKKRSIFNASFEESLNLQDDPISGEFSNKNLASAQEKEKYRGTTKSYVWLTVLTVVFIIGPNWLITALTNYLYHHSEDSPLLPSVHNFLPNWLFIIFLLLWLLLILFGKRFSQQFILIYRGQFHMFVTFLIWLIIEMNLFLLTFLYSTIKATGAILFLFCLGLCAALSSEAGELRYCQCYMANKKTNKTGWGDCFIKWLHLSSNMVLELL
ncbi:hypothetical protein [uncultured Streptococcus sp.]|uniref:hypothetical protein n=1 Tax=uncultured Streptococcus sp. TaxID=83427 RepID=UPI0028E5A8F5|nr:hypothetical protein [uncultured Streptococcus sp.]